mmetsp:Transcript_27237/g.24128  ORF Transcript_27237/g.24128 Transcript_27237/m.24128 type:complete len:121 (+) Transcript_27237:165-527(+)
MDKYLNMEHDHFNKNWEEYEKKLENYLLKEKKYNDWIETTDDNGTKIWVNHKTLKKSKKHPGLKVNKSKLKKEAEEEQAIHTEVVEKRRQRFVQIMTVLLKHRVEEMKKIRAEIFNKIYN